LVYTPAVTFNDGTVITYTYDGTAQYMGNTPPIVGMDIDDFIVTIRPSIRFKDARGIKRDCYGIFINGEPTELHKIPFKRHQVYHSNTHREYKQHTDKNVFFGDAFMHGYNQYRFYAELVRKQKHTAMVNISDVSDIKL